jgi:hypothetical protein
MINALVVPDITRLTLPGGHWIDVKVELTYGEERKMYGQMRTQLAPGEMPVLDPTLIGLARMGAYIVGWSVADANGRPVPVSVSAFDDLKPRMAKAIRDALEAHEEAVTAAQEAEKNDPDGASVSSPISPSVS